MVNSPVVNCFGFLFVRWNFPVVNCPTHRPNNSSTQTFAHYLVIFLFIILCTITTNLGLFNEYKAGKPVTRLYLHTPSTLFLRPNAVCAPCTQFTHSHHTRTTQTCVTLNTREISQKIIFLQNVYFFRYEIKIQSAPRRRPYCTLRYIYMCIKQIKYDA